VHEIVSLFQHHWYLSFWTFLMDWLFLEGKTFQFVQGFLGGWFFSFLIFVIVYVFGVVFSLVSDTVVFFVEVLNFFVVWVKHRWPYYLWIVFIWFEIFKAIVINHIIRSCMKPLFIDLFKTFSLLNCWDFWIFQYHFLSIR